MPKWDHDHPGFPSQGRGDGRVMDPKIDGRARPATTLKPQRLLVGIAQPVGSERVAEALAGHPFYLLAKWGQASGRRRHRRLGITEAGYVVTHQGWLQKPLPRRQSA